MTTTDHSESTAINFALPPLPIPPDDADATTKLYPRDKQSRKTDAYNRLNALTKQKSSQAKLSDLREIHVADLNIVHQILWTNLVLAKENKTFIDLEFDFTKDLEKCVYKNGQANSTSPNLPKDFSKIVPKRIGTLYDLSAIKGLNKGTFPKLPPDLTSLVKDVVDVNLLQNLQKLPPIPHPWMSKLETTNLILKSIPDDLLVDVKKIVPAAAQVNQGLTINDGWFTAGLNSVAKLNSPIIGDFNGDWVPVIIDDTILVYDQPTNSTDKPRTVFAKCDNPTTDFWVPLLEKAYAKLHGDYESIEWGFAAQGVEDLAGGFPSYFDSDHVDKESFWKDQLKPIQIGYDYAIKRPLDSWQQNTVFGLFHWRKNNVQYNKENQLGENGLFYNHVYILLGAYDIGGKRLVKIKSPWTGAEWKGNWSDWDDTKWKAHPQFAFALDFKPFNKDGIFFTDYDTLLNQFQTIDKCEILSDQWYLSSKWIDFPISPSKTPPPSFVFVIKAKSQSLNDDVSVKIVLQQPDSRYITPAVITSLSFEIYPASAQVLLDRAPKYYSTELRNVSYDGKLKPGVYQVIPYVTIYQGNPNNIASIPIGLRIYSETTINENENDNNFIEGNALPYISKL
ncbi:13843_t:CDS:2 [Ambispora leptoticha]|uniref:13843_t:CDS:1 n=1 Tax=Ambispora leptoticha TaxID=144679 RepID=A0A9N8YQX8_9GLOM|nr:13843_t:CDS:2 [Ambispora leptoticha]